MNATQKIILLVLGVMCVATVTAVVIYQYLEQREQPAVMIQPLEVDEPGPNEIPANASAPLEEPSATDDPVALDAPDEPDGHGETSLNATNDEPTAIEQNEPVTERTIRVATWNPLIIETPDWIVPGINKLRNNRRRFNWYDGNYKRYTADLILEINRLYDEGEPVTLILQGWFNMRNVGGGRPEGIDPHGLFTHRQDRMANGLPGIWPEAGKEFWKRASDHLLCELKAAEITVDHFAFDTEVWPHRGNQPFAFEGTFQQIVQDPRWHTEPIAGFRGLTGADIWRDPPLDDRNQLNWLIRRIGEHSFSILKNEVFSSRAIAYYPDALISDYRDHARWLDPDEETSEVRKEALVRICNALGQKRFWRAGMGNTASPPYYGHGVYQGRVDEYGSEMSVLDAMLAHAEEMIAIYGADRVVPWVTSRRRMDAAIHNEHITEEVYREWLASLVNLGIERFLLFLTSNEPIGEQVITVRAFEYAAGMSD